MYYSIAKTAGNSRSNKMLYISQRCALEMQNFDPPQQLRHFPTDFLNSKLRNMFGRSPPHAEFDQHWRVGKNCNFGKLLLLSFWGDYFCNSMMPQCKTYFNLDSQIWKSRISTSTKLKLYNTCILPIFLCGSECWAFTKKDVHKIDALGQWCLRKLLGVKWCHYVRNDDVRQTTEQPHLSSTVQAWRLSLFVHIAWMPDE